MAIDPNQTYSGQAQSTDQSLMPKDWQQMAGAGLGLASGLQGIFGSTQRQQNQIDPFGQYRQQYGQQLQQLMADPSSIAKTPQYQFQLGQGLEAVNRSAGARGMLGSGNRLMELMQFGQGLASQSFNTEANRLANLAGAGIGGGASAAQFGAQTKQGGWDSLAQALGSGGAIQGVSSLYNTFFGGSTPGSGTIDFNTGVGGSGLGLGDLSPEQASMLEQQWNTGIGLQDTSMPDWSTNWFSENYTPDISPAIDSFSSFFLSKD